MRCTLPLPARDPRSTPEDEIHGGGRPGHLPLRREHRQVRRTAGRLQRPCRGPAERPVGQAARLVGPAPLTGSPWREGSRMGRLEVGARVVYSSRNAASTYAELSSRPNRGWRPSAGPRPAAPPPRGSPHPEAAPTPAGPTGSSDESCLEPGSLESPVQAVAPASRRTAVTAAARLRAATRFTALTVGAW